MRWEGSSHTARAPAVFVVPLHCIGQIIEFLVKVVGVSLNLRFDVLPFDEDAILVSLTSATT